MLKALERPAGVLELAVAHGTEVLAAIQDLFVVDVLEIGPAVFARVLGCCARGVDALDMNFAGSVLSFLGAVHQLGLGRRGTEEGAVGSGTQGISKLEIFADFVGRPLACDLDKAAVEAKGALLGRCRHGAL